LQLVPHELPGVIVIGTIAQQLLQIAYSYLVVLVREDAEWQKQQRQRLSM
jgi:hypothetical protein